MKGQPGFDPIGWIASACFGLLVAAVAVTVAVDLLRAVWPFLATAIAVLAVGWLVLQLGLLWQRRQPW